MVQLGANRYGKAEVRVVHVARGAGADGADKLSDWNVSTSLSGDLDAVHLSGDNANVLTTDAQKNTAYAFAQRLGGIEAEEFGLALAGHYVSTQPAISRARVAIDTYDWDRIGAATHSFARCGRSTRRTVVIHDETEGISIVSGLADLVVMNTTDSEFWGFVTDEYTTLAPTKDRILATEVTAWWRYDPNGSGNDSGAPGSAQLGNLDFAATNAAATQALLDTFAGTYSYSLQQTLYAIGTRIIETVAGLCEVRMVMPNKHHFPVDLTPFDQPNHNEVYYAADRPYGLIEGTVLADDAPPAGLAWT